MARLSQSEAEAFAASLPAEGYRVWLTVLDDNSGGQLRVRKLVLSVLEEATGERRAREWYSTSPEEDRWEEIDSDTVRSSTELFELIKRAVSHPSRKMT